MKAPIPSWPFHSLLNHQTLKHRLSALRTVRAILVDTEETCYRDDETCILIHDDALTEDSWFTPDTHISCDKRLANKMENDLVVSDVDRGLIKLVIPCLMSPMRNTKIGSDRKCFWNGRLMIRNRLWNSAYRVKNSFSPAGTVLLVRFFLQKS